MHNAFAPTTAAIDENPRNSPGFSFIPIVENLWIIIPLDTLSKSGIICPSIGNQLKGITTMFEPHLFISVGQTYALFTLRETYLHINGRGETEVRSFHVKNLSNTPDSALAKAADYAEKTGIPLRENIDTLRLKLRDISRRSPEEVEREERERKEQQEREEQERKAYIIDRIANGIMPYGKYFNQAITDIIETEDGIGYLNWFIRKADMSDDEMDKRIADYIRTHHADIIYPTPDDKATIGQPGEKIEVAVTVVKNIVIETRFGRSNLVTMVEENTKACIVALGTFSAPVGQKIRIKTTVKEHRPYRDQMQTRVIRVKEIG